MRRLVIYFIWCVAVVLPGVESALCYPRNLLSAELGARITTQAKLAGAADPNAILSDGPISRGQMRFADVEQERVLTADLGGQREFDRVEIGTGGQLERIRISAADAGPGGSYETLCEIEEPGYFQTFRFAPAKARYIRFDFGRADKGCMVQSVRLYKGYEHPRLVEVTKLLYTRIKPNLAGLENFYEAAAQEDWPKACRELRAYFASEQKPQGEHISNYDLSRAQGLLEGSLDFAGLARTDTVPIDWAYMKTTDWYEHKNFLNRGSPLGVPVDAYYHTGDAKWADFFRAVFYDWLEANPKPVVMSGADYPTWRTLDSAARLGWIVSRFAKVTTGSDIEDELWANYLYSIWEHADYLKNDDFSGGNWLATITASVMHVAQEFPQFSDRGKWLAFGKTGFERNVLRDIYPDGKETEDAPGYICMAFSGMFDTLRILDAEGIAIDKTVRQRLGLALGFIGAVIQPDGLMPAIGDWGGAPFGIDSAVKYFNREDLRYILTKGAEGTAPAVASVNFADGQWSIMRSGYDKKPYEDARHLVFKSSFGPHGHHDVLSITAYAYGRELLIDPGIRSYEHTDIERYTHTAYHNTVCIDGQNQPRISGKTEKWISDAAFDYVCGTYAGYEGLIHRRSVLFVKPRYWVVHDGILGSGRHTCEQNWHFAPDAGVTVEAETESVRTNYPQGGNLLIVPADTGNLDVSDFDFLVATQRMAGSEGGTESRGARYRLEGSLPAMFDVVLYPYTSGEAPAVAIKKDRTMQDTAATCLQVRIGSRTDYICLPNDGSGQVSLRTEYLDTKTRKAQLGEEAPWKRHIIDNTSRGADGVKLADVNGDGLMDIATGWEEGGVTRVYLNPGPGKAKGKWPFVTTGKTPSVEDAVFFDLDADGAVDVVSSCEGDSKSMFVQWAPKDKGDYLDESKWQSEVIPVSKGLTRWMFCIPMQVDQRYGVDLVAGSKEPNAQIGWFESPKDGRDLGAHKWHTISKAGWVMSLLAEDMDGDGDTDILTSDRKGEMRGCRWLENPGPGDMQKKPWANHFIGCRDKEAMFLTVADIDEDGLQDVLAAAKSSKESQIVLHRRLDADGDAWKEYVIAYPPNAGTAKAVVVGDIDEDGKKDIVLSCEGANAPKSGVMWLSCYKGPLDGEWRAHEVSGPEGIKYDLMELLDIDCDGDLDIIACEEQQNKKGLGLFWYENPFSGRRSD
ncbi:MAG: heparinase II/III family protein [Sedimentisphaerales bacterium]|nr:heparinase II/III family protein [Sedimentisphaerales bacterium]